MDSQGLTIRPVMAFKSGTPSGVDAAATHTLPDCNTNTLAPSQGIGDCSVLVDPKFFPAPGAQAPAQAVLVLKVLQGDKVGCRLAPWPCISWITGSCIAQQRLYMVAKGCALAGVQNAAPAPHAHPQVLASSADAAITLGAAPSHPAFVPAAQGLLVTLPYRNVAPGEKLKVTVTAGVSGPQGISAFNIPVRCAADPAGAARRLRHSASD